MSPGYPKTTVYMLLAFNIARHKNYISQYFNLLIIEIFVFALQQYKHSYRLRSSMDEYN